MTREEMAQVIDDAIDLADSAIYYPGDEELSENLTLIAVELRTMDWQPIETAPKDGTPVLLFWAFWSHTPIVGKYVRGGWSNEYALALEGADNGPTHWMPLPAPPANTEGAKVE